MKLRIQLPEIDQDACHLFESPNHTGTPERNMLMAVLERTILDFVGNDQRESSDAEEWLFATEDPELETLSFEWVCHHLDLEPRQILDTVRAMPKRGQHRIAPWYFLKAAG